METPQPFSLSDDGLPKALELKAAAILLLLAMVLIGAAGYVMYARGVFEKSQTLVLIADDAEGVAVGMDMTFAGFAIGRVTRVALHEDGRARLVVEVPQKQGKWLRETSVFTLEKGLIGSPKLKAYTGLLEGPLLADGAQRPVLYGDVSAQIPQITLAAKELLEHLADMTNSESALAKTLNNLQESTDRLNGAHGALGLLMGNDADAKKLAQTLTQSAQLVKTLDGLIASSRDMVSHADQQFFGKAGMVPEVRRSVEQLTGVLSGLRQSMGKIEAILTHAQGIAANTEAATVDLVGLRAELEASLRQVDALINEVNSKWPLSRDVEIKLP